MNTHALHTPPPQQDIAAKLRSLAIDHRQPPPVPSRRPRFLFPAFAIAALLVPGFWALNAALRPAPAQPAKIEASTLPPPRTTSAPVQAGSIIGSGYVTARRRAVLRPDVSGRIAEILVNPGDRVRAGQVIARLDPELALADATLARSRVDSAATAVRMAEIELRDAQHPLVRLQALAKQNFASTADLTAASLKVERLDAALTGARQALATAGIEAQRTQAVLAKYEVRAPFAGIVATRFVSAGDMVSPDTRDEQGIAVLLDPDALSIDVDVAQTSIGRITTGQSASALLDAFPDHSLAMRVETILPEASRQKGTVVVRLGFAVGSITHAPLILPEMAVKVTFDPPIPRLTAAQE